ncbi:MAG: TRAP transporter substrate-binding protein DctP [Pseudomonadota bacterium]
MKHIRTRRLSMPAALAALAGAVIAFAGILPAALAQAPKPVVLRFVSDFPPPPHPAGLAMKHFAERLPQVIPGSEARLYYAGALYTIPEAFEAMRQGNLEMTWMQMGKAAPVDPYMMAVVGPGILTTVGAVDALEKTKTYRFLVERLEKQQLIKVFGAGHMSFGMGVGGKRRYLKPEDFVGRKVRSMGPAENPVLEAWKASPVVMAFGEVPSALESGVIDGLMTSIGGWLGVREQAPFYTTGGAGVFTGDYYMVSASRRWWDRQPKATQEALEKLIAETIQLQKELNWCVDKLTYEKYGTKDPSKPGIYWMTPQEVAALTAALGDGPNKWKKSKMPPAAQQWVDTFTAEGRELSRQHPPGSSWIEKVDCAKHAAKIVIR